MTITHEAVAAQVRELAAESPDFVYKIPEGLSSCVYFDEAGNPSCIVGQALANLGVKAGQLNDRSNRQPYGGSITPRNDRDAKLNDPVVVLEIAGSVNVAKWLRKVQGCQDHGYTWRRAVEKANREVLI